MSDARIIKRYANRKLYDTLHSRYVTLDQIAEMIRTGDDIKIVDNKSKEDLTSVTLAQIIFEEEKKKKNFLSLQAMRNIIQRGVDSGQQFVTEAQRKVGKILPIKGEDAGGPETPAGDDASAKRRELRTLREFREWLVTSQRTIDDWQKRVDERLREVVGGISPFAGLHKEVSGLASRIAELEKKLGEFADDESFERPILEVVDGDDSR